jgi:acetyltransferase-like isoleucine patch superfamily enzyme
MREWLQRGWRALFGPRMLYGWRRADGRWLPHTRISTACRIEVPERLFVDDHVYVGPFNLLDASGDLHIGEGVQVTTHCAVLTHSSHQALRLAGRGYWGNADPPGFVRQATHIGPYCFIGPHSVLMPGTRLGRGVLVKAYSYVDGEVPDFAVIAGQPAVVVGDTRELDQAWLSAHADARSAYDAWAGPGR